MWRLWEESLTAVPPPWEDYIPSYLVGAHTGIDMWALVREYTDFAGGGMSLGKHDAHGMFIDFHPLSLVLAGPLIPPWRWLDDTFTLVWTCGGATLRSTSSLPLSNRTALARRSTTEGAMQEHIRAIHASGDKAMIYLCEDEHGVSTGNLMSLRTATAKKAPKSMLDRFKFFTDRLIAVVYVGKLFEHGVEIVQWNC